MAPISALLTGRGSCVTGLEVRSDRRHEIHGVATAEAAMHALTLAQCSVGDLDRAIGRRLATIAGKRAEVDDDGGCGRCSIALEVDRRHRQRAREGTDGVIGRNAARVILAQQRIDDAPGQPAISTWQIDQIRPAIGGDNHIGMGGIASNQVMPALG